MFKHKLLPAFMFVTAAEHGSDSAQVLLAVIYLHGDGGYGRNKALAAYWRNKAAEQPR